MKYIVFKRDFKGMTRLTPVIFPNALVHQDVADDLMKGSLKDWTPDSAGEFVPMSGACTGRSETLGLVSKGKRDTQLIAMNDYSVDVLLGD